MASYSNRACRVTKPIVVPCTLESSSLAVELRQSQGIIYPNYFPGQSNIKSFCMDLFVYTLSCIASLKSSGKLVLERLLNVRSLGRSNLFRTDERLGTNLLHIRQSCGKHSLVFLAAQVSGRYEIAIRQKSAQSLHCLNIAGFRGITRQPARYKIALFQDQKHARPALTETSCQSREVRLLATFAAGLSMPQRI